MGDPAKVVSVADPAVVELGGQMVVRRAERADLERVAALMVEGRIDLHITSYPFHRAAEALALVESGRALGKIVIDMTAPSVY
ncbi:zinc-binding dehydrogenase [Streptomyces sp. NBC_01264]|uniref:zinc-binding dehydrogenase n=1 Tax=Streptomyces sp. NBC_01264 TaxID=2903804 RepID=UPI002251AA03|nr:zinc-binding dehydrogenase [Streptomyces sp. NBC_01264]MCX4776259.1 zinc-binding dehydrogenase [Streptomyces sp. NBC_01264]